MGMNVAVKQVWQEGISRNTRKHPQMSDVRVRGYRASNAHLRIMHLARAMR